jgi:hypothetical protein
MPVAIIVIVLALICFALVIISMISIEEGSLQCPKWVISLVSVALLLGFWLIASHQGLTKVDDGLYPVTFITNNDGQSVPVIYVDKEVINVAEKTKANVLIDNQINVSHYANSWGINWMKDKQYKVVSKTIK